MRTKSLVKNKIASLRYHSRPAFFQLDLFFNSISNGGNRATLEPPPLKQTYRVFQVKVVKYSKGTCIKCSVVRTMINESALWRQCGMCSSNSERQMLLKEFVTYSTVCWDWLIYSTISVGCVFLVLALSVYWDSCWHE